MENHYLSYYSPKQNVAVFFLKNLITAKTFFQCWFGDNAVTTVQCAKVVEPDLQSCGATVHIIDKVCVTNHIIPYIAELHQSNCFGMQFNVNQPY